METESSFYFLEPEVPGGLGEHTKLEHTSEGIRVLKLHYEFAVGCQGDDLATSHPVFIMSKRVGALVQSAGLTGFELADMEQSVEEQVHDWKPDLQLPTFKWLQVTGRAGRDDFGLDRRQLIVSARALGLMRQHGQLSFCEIEPWTPDMRFPGLT